jgi:hypothetical protein
VIFALMTGGTRVTTVWTALLLETGAGLAISAALAAWSRKRFARR